MLYRSLPCFGIICHTTSIPILQPLQRQYQLPRECDLTYCLVLAHRIKVIGGASADTPYPADDSSYWTYEASGDETLVFSNKHIRQLTIGSAMNLKIPDTHAGRFRVERWSLLIPNNDIFSCDDLTATAPTIDEVRTVLNQMWNQFTKGLRSVFVNF